MEQNVNFSAGKNYSEYNAKAFFGAYGLIDVTFTKRVVTMKNGAKVALTTLRGVNPNDGQRISLDLWPSRCQTLKDIAEMPDTIGDIIIRFGRYEDEATGEVVEAGAPRVYGFFVGKDEHFFHGNKPEFVDGASVYTNDEATTKE